MKKLSELIKDKCEIEGCDVSTDLHLHHIVPRTDVNTSNHPMNCALLCPTHHSFCHSGSLVILGLFPSTRLPNHRTLVYSLNGVKNIDIDVPYYDFKPKSYKIFNKE